jgi:ribonuclease HI
MELTAAIEGLRALKRPCEVTIYSDSEYVVKGVNEHQRHKENLDLWRDLLALLPRHKVVFVKRSHGEGDPLFDECHRIARSRTFV